MPETFKGMFLDKKLKNFTGPDFKEASSYAKKEGYLKGKERKALYNFGRTLDRGKQLSPKQLSWAESLIDELRRLSRSGAEKDLSNPVLSNVVSHITVRQAWHDNKWNGRICKKPSENDYCIGDYSLLSSRIRHRRDDELEDRCAGCLPDLNKNEGYVPPCFWSINTFGNESFEVRHQHPMSKVQAEDLYEELGSTSVFTWPFKLSFTRDRAEQKQQGNYPKNLETRIERYFNKVKPDESIVFTYCNYDNPVSGDDQLYLITGCGLVRNVIAPEHFDIKNYEEIKSQKGHQNFPTINWSTQVRLDPDSLVRIPYHEYLDDAEKSGDFTLLNRTKVVVEESQLVRCFKYVSIDVDDDEAIFLLTKIKRSLDIVKQDGLYKEYPVDESIQRVEDLLEHCWNKRGYFPGFAILSASITGRPESINEFAEFISEWKLQVPVDEHYEALSDLLSNPELLEEYNLESAEDLIFDLSEGIEAMKLKIDEFLKLALIDLLPAQFEKIIEGDKDGEITARSILNNPFLLYELYREEEWKDDPVRGETVWGPVDLFKIDIALYPDRKYLTKIRDLQNLSESDDRRIRAIIIQHLENLENQGHCFDRDDQIMEKLTNYPLFYKSEYRLPSDLLGRINESLKHFLEEKLVIKEDKHHYYFYLNSVHQAEEEVANIFHRLLDMEDLDHSYTVDLTESIQLSDKLKDNFVEDLYIEERQKLFDSVFSKRLYVLTGVPGSGKSFELLRIIENLRSAGESYTLLTPTGKAALRLTLNEEGIPDIEAKTIDKFLAEHKDAPPHSIELKNLIIDEMSMVDLGKFHELIRLVNFNSSKFSRLILVGDPNQLPPIGYGKVFVDIIEYIFRNPQYHDNIVTLETNCRVEQDKRIQDVTELFAGHAKYGDDITWSLAEGDSRNIDGLSIDYWKTRDELREQIKKRFSELCSNIEVHESGKSLEIALNRLFGLRDNGTVDNTDYNFQENLKIDRFQIISPYRAGFYSSLGLNLFIQNELKRERRLAYNSKFKTGDKIIQTRNKYDKKGELYLSNGSMGVFKGSSKNKARLYFLENPYPQKSNYFDEDEELELAYAITVHKSQGSGFEHTFIVIPNKKTLLSKEMLYTALTRSKKSMALFIYGSGNEYEENYDFLNEIINRSDIATRRTTLMDKTFWGYSLSPQEGVQVKSRAEYIIYKKLEEFSENRTKFNFSYESPMELEGRDFEIRPDFTIQLQDGSVIYWEHLGMLNSKKYVKDWMERKKLFLEEQKLNRVITTDETHGLDDSKIETIIQIIAEGKLAGLKNRFSNHHYFLG